MNKVLITTILFLVLLAPVHAQDSSEIDIKTVKIDGDVVDDGETLRVERGDTIDIRVRVEANETVDVEGAQIEARIPGYDHIDAEFDKVFDFTDTFDLDAGNTDTFDLELEVPKEMDTRAEKIHITLFTENSGTIEQYVYQLNIEGLDDDNALEITDFYLVPSNSIEAGQSISYEIRVKNYGDEDIDDASVLVSIPELGIRDFESMPQIDADDSRAFESLFTRISPETPSGEYTVEARVEFDSFESTVATDTIVVEGRETQETEEPERTTRVTVPESISLTAGGQSAVFPIVIQNEASTSQTYVLSTTGISNWGTGMFEPGSVAVVQPGQSQTVYLRLEANKNVTGQRTFGVNIESDEDQTSFNAMVNIEEAPQPEQTQSSTVQTILEWALVVLVVVLVVLGLVLLFKKDKKDEEPEEEEPDYY